MATQLEQVVALPVQVRQGVVQEAQTVPLKYWFEEHWMHVFEGVRL